MNSLLPMRRDGNQSKRIDARIISLDTRGLLSVLPSGPFTDNRYCAFSYYASITVKGVDLTEYDFGNPLIEAYNACFTSKNNKRKNSVLSQLVFAFTDISDERGVSGYTQEQIDAFWMNKQHPVFFMTMIKVAKDTSLKFVLAHIKTLFAGQLHLAYLTFDHTDIILFCKGSSFKYYSQLLLKLNYKRGSKVEDTITCFGFGDFANAFTASNVYSDDSFSALLTFGIKDLVKAQEFSEKVRGLRKKVTIFSMLGRNDMGIYCPRANLQWLARVWDFVKQDDLDSEVLRPGTNAHWYTTYDLLIQVPTRKITAKSPNLPTDVSDLRNYMESRYEKFKSAYTTLYTKLGFSYDSVWLRWLRDSSTLAVDFLGNSLSFYLGVCIVPQFFDLYNYATMIMNCDQITISSSDYADQAERERERAEKWEYLERLETSFSSFFSAIAVLIDSTNQTNRQFVQVPSFHLPSFSVPPKIAAFFSAVAYRLLELFHDDEDTSYNLMLVPKTINKLGVQSHAIQEILPKHQWLEIMISEPSYYEMQLTLETMGHEISHVDGQSNRCRNERRDLMVQCAIALYVDLLLSFIPELTTQMYPSLKADFVIPYRTQGRLLFNLSKHVFETAKNNQEYLFTANDLSRDDVLKNIIRLIDGFYSNPSLFNTLESVLRKYDYDFNRIIKSEHINGLTPIKYLQELNPLPIINHIPSQQQLNTAAKKDFLERRDSFVRSRFSNIVQTLTRTVDEAIVNEVDNKLCDLDDLYPSARSYWIQLAGISACYYETFADLQMILLFELDWTQYCRLIIRDSNELVHDALIRVLAVARALVETHVWSAVTVTNADNSFRVAEKLVTSDIYSFESFANEGIDPIIVYYLVEYLKKCVKVIQKNFKNPGTSEKLRALRTVHQSLADGTPILKLQNEMRDFIDDFYRDYIIGKCFNVNDSDRVSADPEN